MDTVPWQIFSVIVTVCLATVIVNALIMGQCIKLYTEYFKDRSASRRRETQP